MTEVIGTMTGRLSAMLGENLCALYLYGSAASGDYREGWSDMDILALTEQSLSVEMAESLVGLRQRLCTETGEPRYRAFEGGILSLSAFLKGTPEPVVYWGTSGERVMDRYELNALNRLDLLRHGILLAGADVRDSIPCPTYAQLRENIRCHYETIRRYGKTPGANFYAFGWLFDIARCLYTLETGEILPKTQAGEWALAQNRCPIPVREALQYALTVRRDPLSHKTEAVYRHAASLSPAIQRFADTLELALQDKTT